MADQSGPRPIPTGSLARPNGLPTKMPRNVGREVCYRIVAQLGFFSHGVGNNRVQVATEETSRFVVGRYRTWRWRFLFRHGLPDLVSSWISGRKLIRLL